MSRKRSVGKKSPSPRAKGKSLKATAMKADNFYHKAVKVCKMATMLFAFVYVMGGTLAMGIVYHQHQGHMLSWLAGDEASFQKQAAMQKKRAMEEAELEAECHASYHMSCTEYALSIAEATQSNGKRDAKQVAMLEREKNKAKAM